MGPFEERAVFLDLSGTREWSSSYERIIQVRSNCPFIGSSFGERFHWGARPARGISFSASLFYPISALRSVWLSGGGPRGHPVSQVAAGECEIRPSTWDRANDLWAGHLTCDSLGACSAHPLLYVRSRGRFWFLPGVKQFRRRGKNAGFIMALLVVGGLTGRETAHSPHPVCVAWWCG